MKTHHLCLLILISLFLNGCNGDSDTITATPGSEGGLSIIDQHAMVVDSPLDQPDTNPGDHICASQEGLCTIRAAIMEANASGFNAEGERHSIFIPAGYYDLSIPNTLSTDDLGVEAIPSRPVTSANATGSLLVVVPMTIRGEGARSTVIDANQIDRVFEIDVSADSTISDLAITGGAGNTLGGGVYAQALVRLQRVLITGNTASGGGGIFINPLGTLELMDSTVSYNIAANQAGGIRIDSRGTITNSTISHNEAGGLAPLPLGAGPAPLVAKGGGVDVRGIAVTIMNSTIAYNRADGGGGGLHYAFAYLDSLPDALMEAIDVPLFDVILSNSIIANNESASGPADCYASVGISKIHSQGNNIDSDGSCSLNVSGDLLNVDPRLGPLENNGGPTDTHRLLADSPAIGAGNTSSCTARDQQGALRANDGACDIGAYESR